MTVFPDAVVPIVGRRFDEETLLRGTEMNNSPLQNPRQLEREPAFFERLAMTLERLALRFARLSRVEP